MYTIEGRRISRTFLDLPGSNHSTVLTAVVHRLISQKYGYVKPPLPVLDEKNKTVKVVFVTEGLCRQIEEVLSANKLTWTISGKDNLTLNIDLTIPLGVVKRLADSRIIEKVLGNSEYYTRDDLEEEIEYRKKLPNFLTRSIESPETGFDFGAFQNQVRAVADKFGVHLSSQKNASLCFAMVAKVVGSPEELSALIIAYRRLGFIFRSNDILKADAKMNELWFHKRHPDSQAIVDLLKDWKPSRGPKADVGPFWRATQITAFCRRQAINYAKVRSSKDKLIIFIEGDERSRTRAKKLLQENGYDFAVDRHDPTILEFALQTY